MLFFMILYNVTVKLDKAIEADWLKWMQQVHIPDVLKTGLFIDHKLCRILIDETDGVSFSVQYFCKDMGDFQRYQDTFAKVLQADHSRRYKDRFVAFRTLMEVL